tara:strand:+ start:31 stop:564 length:534 start_codon:yes stop_codon:yes gene_type:complete
MVFMNDWYADLAILESYLETVDYKTSTSRLQKFGIKRSVGGSVTYGLTKRSYLTPTLCRELCPITKMYKTVLFTDRPELMPVFQEFRDLYFPGFEFTSVQLNKNYKIGRHKDIMNCGESVLISCGDYVDGLTVVEIDDIHQEFDSRLMPVVFDGSKYFHYVKDFTGTRYSCVFYRDI